jgi:hypothetical protein
VSATGIFHLSFFEFLFGKSLNTEHVFGCVRLLALGALLFDMCVLLNMTDSRLEST